MMNSLTLESVLTDTRTKSFALITAVLMFMGVGLPRTAFASGSAGGVGGLKVDFGKGGATLTGGGFDSQKDSNGVWGDILTRFHTQIAAVFGVFMLVALYKFGELLVKLIMTSDNPRGRGEIITGLIVAGIATAALGAATILFGFFYHLLL